MPVLSRLAVVDRESRPRPAGDRDPHHLDPLRIPLDIGIDDPLVARGGRADRDDSERRDQCGAREYWYKT